MDVVDQPLDDRLAVLQGELARAQGRTKAALDHRVDSLRLPTLPVYSVQPALGYQLSACFTSRVYHVSTPPSPYGRNEVSLLYSSAVKACICQHHPLASSSPTCPFGAFVHTIVSIPASITSEAIQVGSINARSSTTAPTQDELRVTTHTVGSFLPPVKGAPTPRLVVSRCSRWRKAGGVGGEHLFATFHPQLREEQLFHLVEVADPQLLVGTSQRGMVRHSRKLKLFAHRISSQQPLFHVSIAQLHVEGHQHTGGKLRQRKVMWALGVRVKRQGALRQPIADACYSHVPAFSLTAAVRSIARVHTCILPD